jgi:hypothetical protein
MNNSGVTTNEHEINVRLDEDFEELIEVLHRVFCGPFRAQ